MRINIVNLRLYLTKPLTEGAAILYFTIYITEYCISQRLILTYFCFMRHENDVNINQCLLFRGWFTLILISFEVKLHGFFNPQHFVFVHLHSHQPVACWLCQTRDFRKYISLQMWHFIIYHTSHEVWLVLLRWIKEMGYEHNRYTLLCSQENFVKVRAATLG